MNGRCTYTLDTLQITFYLFRRHFFRIVGISTAFILICMAVVFALSWEKHIDFKIMLVTGGIIIIFQTAGELIAFLFLFLKGKKAPPLPAGKTTLEWDGAGISAWSGQQYVHIPWDEATYSLDKQNTITLLFPGGHYTFVSKEFVPEATIQELLRILENGPASSPARRP